MLKTRPGWPLIFLIIAALMIVPVASATLSPMSFGFPTMINTLQSTGFNHGTSTAYDLESADFSPFGGSTLGIPGFGFPTLSQSGVQGVASTQVEFSQNTQFQAISYPSVGVGTNDALSGFNIPGFGNLL
jgi:hypothetical protein